MLERIRFPDHHVDKWGFSALREFFALGSTPAQLVARICFLTILMIGLLTGLSALDPRLPSLLIERLFSYLPWNARWPPWSCCSSASLPPGSWRAAS